MIIRDPCCLLFNLCSFVRPRTNIADADPDAKHVRRWVKGNAPLGAMPVVWAIAVLGLAFCGSCDRFNLFATFGLTNVDVQCPYIAVFKQAHLLSMSRAPSIAVAFRKTSLIYHCKILQDH